MWRGNREIAPGDRPGAPLPARGGAQVEELATREPERVAQQIRTWMRDS